MRTANARLVVVRRLTLLACSAALVIGAVGTWMLAAAGDLDPTFGIGGKVTTNITGCCDTANAVAIQTDGKIVAAGVVWDLLNSAFVDTDFALTRYNADGTLDPTFGDGGIVVTKFLPNNSDVIRSLVLQPDGKIVVGGYTSLGPVTHFAAARYLPNGVLDPTFSDDGKAIVAFPSNQADANAIAIQPDGRIVLVGRAWSDISGWDFAVARLLPNGSLDVAFGSSGTVTTPISIGSTLDIYSPDDIARAMVIQPDGRIIAGGSNTRQDDGGGGMTLVRYLPDGSIDASFGTDGKLIFDFYGYYSDVTGLALQADGKIVAAGSTRNPTAGLRWEFALVRLDSSGAFDPTFDGDGKVTTVISPLDPRAHAMAIGADGRMVVVGTWGNDLAVARYRANGALDTSFSTDGIVTTDLGGYETALAVAVQPDGRVITAGNALPITGGGGASTFLLFRYESDGGTVAQTIDFPPLSDRTFGDPPFLVSATATSGLPVTFSASGACTVVDATVTLTGSGTCSITASQNGDETYAPALDVTRTFQVLNARTLTVTVAGTGSGRVTSSPAGIDCGSDCTETYQDGVVVTLTALPAAGSSFISWGGDVDCSDGAVTMTSNVACTATFDRTATTTTLSSTLNPSTFGQPVTFTAVVTGSSPTGSVTLLDGDVQVGAPAALSGGTAAFALSSLAAGAHTLTARYNGDANNAGSTSPALVQVVNKLLPVITLASSRNPSAPGEAVTFSGSLPAAATGTVTIVEGAAPLGGTSVTAGAYSLTLSSLGLGSHTLRARYNGDDNHLPADSPELVQVVAQVNNAPQIGSVGDQLVTWGSLVDLFVGASDQDGDALTFSLLGPPAGASITAAGRFTWTPSADQVGVNPITVQVSDGQLAATTSFNVTVGRRATTVSYLGAGAAAAGPVELSARLTEASSNAALAGRTILFQLGVQSVTGVTDASGLASASLVLNQTVGIVTVSASFSGDGAYEASTSGTMPFRIDAPPVVAPIAPQSIAWGGTLNFFVDASDPDGGSLVFSLVNAPAGVSLAFESATRRRVVWTPTQAQVGLASITIGVSDGVSLVPVTASVDVLRHPTTIAQIGPGASGAGPVVLTATLVDAVNGSPLANRSLLFALGGQSAAAVTDAMGVARAPLNLAQPPQATDLIVSFAGDAAHAAAQATSPFVIYADADGDGIRDEWEINGVDINGDGTIDLNLPAMGANPRRKDVFVEVDWMVKPNACVWLVCWSNGGVLQPQRAVLDSLIARFATAPVSNPDGSIGISLHVDGGPDTAMNAAGQPWGTLSRAGVVPYDASLGSVDPAGNYDWSEFEALKQAFFEPARRAVFHYAIYADTLGNTSAGGISRGIPAADFVLAAGHPSWNGGLTATQERSLFMHELGHNLAGHHGGGDDINYKPNYHSVLNYLWSLTGLPPDGRPDYSTVAEPAIDETVAGDVNNDGRIDLLLGYEDWPNLVFNGGGIGDLQALPAPSVTPLDPIVPEELRARRSYARDGDGMLEFKGPSLLVLDSGVQLLAIDVKNISEANSDYIVSAQSALFAGPLSTSASVAASSVLRVTLPVNTAGLLPGEYRIAFSLHNGNGELLHHYSATVVVVDLTVPENQQAAREAVQALATLSPDSGLDASVRDQIVRMFANVAASWTIDVNVTGQLTFAAVYSIDEPNIGPTPGRITAQSLPGTPILELTLLRAGKAATGWVRLQRPSGEIFVAAISGRWNESARVFEGKWFEGKQAGGSILFSIREP